MSKEIIVNAGGGETRAVVMEDGAVVDIHIERPGDQRLAGNIYKGRVENVLPGMQAAFVDIGLDRNAFLYVEDALSSREMRDGSPQERDDESGRDAGDEDEDMVEAGLPSIKDVVKVGQEIIVQVTKESIGTKGARIVTRVTLPGRYLVLMPTLDYVGVSRRIEDENERARLRRLADRLRPRGMGLIVRTVAEGRTEKDLSMDMNFLVRVWKRLHLRARRARAPVLLHREYDLIYRIVRDSLTEDVEKFIIDNSYEYEKAMDLVNNLSPHLKNRIKLFREKKPIFDFYNVEEQVEKATRHKVWLNCGGYLVFDQTEALMSIDVNTGKYIGSVNLADTVLKTNLEAAAEIARQLRLRNVGGIIVVDFIDMEFEEDRSRVIACLEEGLKRDKTKATVLGFTNLGLVEMTRKKVRQGLDDVLQRPCPYCDGRGKVLSEESMALKTERDIKRLCLQSEEEAMLIKVHPSVAAILIGAGGANLARIEEDTKRCIYIKGDESLHLEEIRVMALGAREEVEKKALPVRAGDVIEVEIEEQHVTNSRDGIARLEGYIVDIEGGGQLVGKKVRIEITRAFRTYAKGRLIYPKEAKEDISFFC